MYTQLLQSQLISEGFFVMEELQPLCDQAEEDGIQLSDFLLKKKKITEGELLKLESKLFDIELLDSIPDEFINPELVQRFSIQFLRQAQCVPLLDDGRLILAIGRARMIEAVEEFSFVLKGAPHVVLAPSKDITRVINNVFGSADMEVSGVLDEAEDEFGNDITAETIEDLLDDSSDAPLIKLVNMIMAQAVRANASDVHIEPFKDSLRVRFRLDGVLYDKHSLPRRLHAAMVSRIKIMGRMNIAEKRLPQDGRISLSLGGRQVDLRVSCLPTSYGERIVLRLLEKNSKVLSIKELGLGSSNIECIKELVTVSHGIILVTGPTGSGKTTSLYAILNYINSPDKNILTIEDPVEYQIEGIGQMQVNKKINLNFADGLRSIVRQDPDVILIGEIRDKETADIAIQSALTGHLVFSTLHTNDAPSAVARLIDMGVEPFLLSSVLRAVIAQRLVRVLCPHCKVPFVPDKAAVTDFGAMAKKLDGKNIFKAGGCDECMNTGYQGRNAIYEVMNVSDEIKGLVVRSADSNQIRKQALADGMKSLKMDGFRKVLEGKTTLAEVKRVTNL
ncbi:type II secretion system ATPase GspE [Maridesulfovibrio bastinii]|uniref:type II secretion system ATPase GspE n=1 Tax=Maridesulfovibrio bastinii TaxID=47157 RepID=UPI000407FF7C|nr:type II secretion system ATPase GspE [Maridesulfovibrio bastinii]